VGEAELACVFQVQFEQSDLIAFVKGVMNGKSIKLTLVIRKLLMDDRTSKNCVCSKGVHNPHL
jgi:hypothetical protein